MVDRTDIDALLIGALYGELTPADEARLTAHLESHPADRTALDRLTRTRAAVHDSHVLAFSFEPPHAISALLLQEASRRAPRAATARDGGEAASWFQRFVRSFVAHPAMAGAAMLVLVISAAGTFYLRGTDQFARSEPPPVAVERATATATTAPAAPTGAEDPPAAALEPEAPHADHAPGAPSGAPPSGQAGPSDESRANGGSAAGSGSYRAGLDEIAGSKAEAVATPASAAASGQRGDPGGLYARDPYEKAKAGDNVASGAGRDVGLRKLGATEEPPAKADRAKDTAKKVRGIELKTPQLMPKDFPGDFKESDDDKPAPARREVRNDRRAASESARDLSASATAPPRGGAPAAPPAPAAEQAAGPAAAPALEPAPAASAQEAPANTAKRAAGKLTAKPAPAPVANNATNAQVDRRIDKTANTANTANAKQAQAQSQSQAEDKSARDRTLLEWARKQREQVIALVSSNRCRDAASAALEIYNRAPDYFNANIATDRQIKPCLAYVNDQRERAERNNRAAAKNAFDVPPPAEQAPTRK